MSLTVRCPMLPQASLENGQKPVRALRLRQGTVGEIQGLASELGVSLDLILRL